MNTAPTASITTPTTIGRIVPIGIDVAGVSCGSLIISGSFDCTTSPTSFSPSSFGEGSFTFSRLGGTIGLTD